MTLFFWHHFLAMKTALRRLFASPVSAIIVCVVIGLTLALPTGLMVLLQNTQFLSGGLDKTAQVSIYLKLGVSQNQMYELNRVLHQDQAIQQVEYISPEQGMDELEKTMQFGSALKELKQNPIPAVFVLNVAPSFSTSEEIQPLVSRLERLPGVDYVQSDIQWAKRLKAIRTLLHDVMNALFLLFGFAVLVIISHTIHLAMQGYRDEIEVLKLIGAGTRFIRRPFLYSGIFYGLFGSLFAWLFIELLVIFLRPSVARLVGLYHASFSLQGVSFHAGLSLIGLSIGLGWMGSWLSMKR
ncbi:MAG: permease-like cell division protein FtsX [Gammaproteobacteria bacterium]|nr:permease-like cell division protein FtsX [Gammaproteobacteria bacterium]